MCGIAGIMDSGGSFGGELEDRAGRMAATLTHRGPDDSGTWASDPQGVALGFRRLSIIDLSPLGHQPMGSPSGRFEIAFNGEIYNHRALRAQLEQKGHTFRGHSDTEVILAAFEEWGVGAAVPLLDGMFAIAVWDGEERALHLVRDRLGIKPLFIYSDGTRIAFASELKALAALPELDLQIDQDALAEYFRYLYVPAPRTIFQHARKLRPGHRVRITDSRASLPDSRPFWSAVDVARSGMERPFQGSEAEAVDEAERLIMDATRLRTFADVPVGAFLSGGIDSSTVVALMQACSSAPVKTFTVAFDVAEHDEGPAAARVAEHLGTDHTQVALSGTDVQQLIPLVPEIFDEPLADPSQLPTYLISKVARRDVTVALSGDGGDEVFGGYNRYTHGARLLGRLMKVPRPLRTTASRLIGGVPYDRWDRLFRTSSRFFATPRLAGQKITKIGSLLRWETERDMYRSLLSAWQDPAEVTAGGSEQGGALERVFSESRGRSLLDRMMLTDQLEYLPDDLLAKVDRASMAVALEVRVPILDHRVVEFSWSLPDALKVRGRTGKWILREVLKRRVPEELVDRPKVGFTIPIDEWLRGDLRGWAEDLLSADSLRVTGLLREDPIARAWNDFQRSRTQNGVAFWAILMFVAWHERWMRGGKAVGSSPPTRERVTL